MSRKLINKKAYLLMVMSPLVLGTTLGLTGCGSEETQDPEEDITEEASGVEEAAAENEPEVEANEETEPAAEQEPEEALEQEAEEEPEEATTTELGKRTNPVPLGESIQFTVQIVDYEAEDYDLQEGLVEVTLSNILSGDDAYEFLLEENPYNEEAPEGYEWVVFDIEATLLEGDDNIPYIPMPMISTVSESGAESPDGHYATLNNEFGYIDLFAGGTTSGKQATIAPVEEPYLIKWSEDRTVFFDIKPTEDNEETNEQEAELEDVEEEEAVEEPEEPEEERTQDEMVEPDSIEGIEGIEGIEEGTSVSPEMIVEFLQNDGLGQSSDIHYDEEMAAILVTPHDDAIADAFMFSDIPEVKEDFEYMVDNFIYLSEVIYDAGSVGLVLINPQNTDNILLWLEDGIILYNAADGL